MTLRVSTNIESIVGMAMLDEHTWPTVRHMKDAFKKLDLNGASSREFASVCSERSMS